MKGSEVAKALEEGKKVRIKSWVKNAYVSLDGKGITKDEKGESIDLYAYSIFSYEWEEFTESLKVGDWVVNVNDSQVLKIDEIKNTYLFDYDVKDLFNKGIAAHKVNEFIKATEEEIQLEKEKRKWVKWNRKVNEWKVGDVFITDEYDFPLIVSEVGSNFAIESDGDKFILNQMNMVCPVEMRQDLI